MPITPENRNRYPKDWPLLSYVVRYFRAGGRCEWIDPVTGERCSRMNGEPIPGNKKGAKTILTVMHLDHQPEHCDLPNLRACCQRHHLLYDAKIHAQHAARTRQRKTLALYKGTLFGSQEPIL